MEYKEYRKLHAEWYELLSDQIDHSKEVDFWARSILEAGEPALELGNGTGRVLIPLLEQGFQVVGIDTSKDMTARCLARCQTKGLQPELYEQSMLELDLPHRFGLVFLDSGGLGLFTSDQDIHAVFERVMAHLKPEGFFIFEFELPPSNINETNLSKWGNWEGDWVKGPDGIIIAWRLRRKYDLATRIWETLFIVEKYAGGSLVETEVNERTGRRFTIAEAVQYARYAGFDDIRVTDWLTDDPPHDKSEVITVRCRKPAMKVQ